MGVAVGVFSWRISSILLVVKASAMASSIDAVSENPGRAALLIEVRDSRTEYLVPVRGGQGKDLTKCG